MIMTTIIKTIIMCGVISRMFCSAGNLTQGDIFAAAYLKRGQAPHDQL